MKNEIRPNFWKIFAFLWEFFTEKAVPAPPGVEEWVRRHFDVVRLRDRDAYLELVFPASRAALEEGGPMDKLIAKEFADGPLPEWVLKVTEVQEREALLLEDLLVYPVRPTHLARASGKLPGKSKTEVWYLVRQGDAWYSVLPVPKPQFAERMKAQAQAKEAGRADIAKLYYAADPGKLTKLRELLRQNRKVDAIRMVQADFRLSLGEAREFLSFVEAPKP